MVLMTRAERREQTRRELVEAADRVFGERGFHGASLDLVAAAAGYTKGAVYSNFASKEDLFFAVYERRVEAHRSAVDERTDPFELTARTLAGPRDRGWLAVFFEFWAHVLRHPEHRARFLALHRRAQEPLRRASAARGLDPELTVASFALVSGLGLEQLTDPELDTAELGMRLINALRGEHERQSADGPGRQAPGP